MRKGLQSLAVCGETVPKWNGCSNSRICNEFARSYRCHEMSFRVRSCHLPIFGSPRRVAMAAHSLQSWQQQRGTSWAEKDGERLIAEGLGRPLRSTAPLLHFWGWREPSNWLASQVFPAYCRPEKLELSRLLAGSVLKAIHYGRLALGQPFQWFRATLSPGCGIFDFRICRLYWDVA